MKSAQSAAISANERTFPIFAKKLASKDFKEYVTTARKLATWLGSEKAYYPAARPKVRSPTHTKCVKSIFYQIVELLEVA